MTSGVKGLVVENRQGFVRFIIMAGWEHRGNYRARVTILV